MSDEHQLGDAPVAALPSRRRSLHASPRTVWDSLIYEEGAVV